MGKKKKKICEKWKKFMSLANEDRLAFILAGLSFVCAIISIFLVIMMI
jgi:type IV secretory pathway component VirB8